ncbi:MAG: MATE family efflux transporter [Vicinamibacterales bacterium]
MSSEIRPLLRLALPVVLAEIGWMSMGLVDTIMVGPLGPAAIAATGMGSGVFTAIAIFGMGLMLGLDALVSRAFGAERLDECVRWLHHGVTLAVIVAPLVMLATWLAFLTMDRWGLHEEIRGLAGPYLQAIAFGALPLLLYAAFRRYLQGLHVVRPIMFALVSANIVNAAANWGLIYGNLGLPALGVEGSAWATSLARLYMASFLFVAIRREHRRRGDAHPRVPYAISWLRMWQLLALGAPAASQITLEVGVFALVTALAARLDPISSASHQIALNIASVVFMVPLGLASASAVRVGHAVGAGDARRAIRAGWTALGAGAAVMIAIGVVLFAFPRPLLRAFTDDARVLEIGTGLLFIAAAFQLFDGTQAVATGILRGLGDTRTPMIGNMIGHWALGLPIGYALCFRFAVGVNGLWIGLSIGLIFVSIVLVMAWIRRTRHLSLPGGAHAPAVPDLL